MKYLFTILVLSFSITSYAYDNPKLKALEKAHSKCISNALEKTYSKVSCDKRVDFEVTNRNIKMACDLLIEEEIGSPNSHSELNDLRNFRENTALVAYDVFDTKVYNLKRNCKVSKALKNELRKQPLKSIKIYSNEGIF